MSVDLCADDARSERSFGTSAGRVRRGDQGLGDGSELPGMSSIESCTTQRRQVAGWNHGAGYGNYRLGFQP